MSIFAIIDDKHVPLFRVMWIASVPHFCGSEDCLHEGDYEVRLEQGESVWANREERDQVLVALQQWHDGVEPDEDDGDAAEDDSAEET